MANPLIALQVQEPNIDVGGSLAKGQEIQSGRLGNMLRQYQLSQAQRQDALAMQKQNLLRTLGPGLASGDQSAVSQYATIDPAGAQGFQKGALENQDAKIKTALSNADFLGRQGQMLLSADPAMRPMLYSRALQMAASNGMDVSRVPQQYDDSVAKQMIAGSISAKDQIQQHLDAVKAAETGRHDLATEANARGQLGVAQTNAAETHRHNQQMEGGALDANGMPPIDDPVTKSHVANIISGNENMQNVPAAYRNRVSLALQATPTASYSPTGAAKLTLASNRITAPFTNMAAYKLTADGLPYLQRIDAASKTPGSVSDQDLLDSLTKLNTGGNAVTDAQVSLITHGKSFADTIGTWGNKLKNGGVLSDNQREKIKEIANHIYENYRKGYQPVYEQATKQLKDAGIPEPFWTIPDLNKLNAGQANILENPPPPPAAGSGKVVHWNDLK